MNAHTHTLCSPLLFNSHYLSASQVLWRTRHHQRCGDELHSCAVLVEDGKSPSYGVGLFYWLHLLLSLQTQTFKKAIAVSHLSSSQKANPIAFFCFAGMSQLSQQIFLSSFLGKIFLRSILTCLTESVTTLSSLSLVLIGKHKVKGLLLACLSAEDPHNNFCHLYQDSLTFSAISHTLYIFHNFCSVYRSKLRVGVSQIGKPHLDWSYPITANVYGVVQMTALVFRMLVDNCMMLFHCIQCSSHCDWTNIHKHFLKHISICELQFECVDEKRIEKDAFRLYYCAFVE